MSLRKTRLPALGVAEVDGGSDLAVLIQKSQPVLSASGNFPVSTGLFPVSEAGFCLWRLLLMYHF